MDRLLCPCLNVSVSCRRSPSGEGWNTRPVNARHLFPESSSDRLLSTQIYEVDLDVGGVYTEHKVLLGRRCVEDWNIHTCFNCDTDVFVSHSRKEESGRVFITDKLMSDPTAVSAVMKDERYSQVFKILLHNTPDDGDMFRRKRVSSMSFGRDDPVMKVAHAQMKSYLNSEQEAMEERIGRFESEQRKSFALMQQKAHDDRSKLFAVIAKARENVISDAISESQTSKTKTVLNTQPHTSKPTEFKGHVSPVPQQTKVTIALKDPHITMVTDRGKVKSSETNEEEMFLLDGFDEDHTYLSEDVDSSVAMKTTTAFPQSDDDEEISTDDSSFRDVSALVAVGGASSVPVNVPMFPRIITRPAERSRVPTNNMVVDDDFDPSELGDTIRQLALSVQDTGMFGDLPRPRTRGYHRR